MSADDRKSLRARLREDRRALPPAVRMAAAEAVAATFRDRLGDRPGHVAGYWASDGELPLHALQLRLAATQAWCLPVIQPDRLLRFGPWRPGDPLASNRHGIPEPELAPTSLLEPGQLAIVLLPLLGFTRDGQRLGMGGGYYDRSFAFRHSQASPPLLVGVGYAAQEIDGFEPRDWDVPLDAVLTEHEWIDCGR